MSPENVFDYSYRLFMFRNYSEKTPLGSIAMFAHSKTENDRWDSKLLTPFPFFVMIVFNIFMWLVFR